MKTRISILILCFSSCAFCQNTNDDRPILREKPERLVAIIDATCRVNVATACVNVTRDVAQKKLRLYATDFRAKTGVRKIEGFEVDVIYNYDLVAQENKMAIPYYSAHNHQVFSFAIAQFAAGKKELGLQLTKLIAEIHPEFWWSSPTHDPFPIKDIVYGLNKSDDSVKALLKSESEQWAYIVKVYGDRTTQIR